MTSKRIPTFLGVLAILCWSTSIAISRSLAQKTGTLHAAFFYLLGSGLILLAMQLVMLRKRYFGLIAGLTRAYWFKVGGFMVVNMIAFYSAVGEAATVEAVIVVGIINYLWPGLTFLFSVPILHNKAKASGLILGILAGFIGTAIAFLESRRLAGGVLATALQQNIFPYLLAATAAFCWGIYSNMTRKYRVKEDIVAVPIFFLTAAVGILGLLLLRGELPHLRLNSVGYIELAYMIVFPTSVAYVSWDRAMKYGDKNLVVALSYMIPLISTLTSGFYLKVPIGIGFILAALMVVGGAILCRRSITS